MFELSMLLRGFEVAFQPSNIAYAFFGTLSGTLVGVLPGLDVPTVLALLLPITYQLHDPLGAVIMMAGIFYGACFGGSRSSILFGIPGEATSAVTAIDGHALAREGKAAVALAAAVVASFVGGTLSIVALTLLAQPLASVALLFGPPEYFSLALLGLTLTVYLLGDSPTKGIIMAILGLLLSMVGLDPVSGVPRLTFGSAHLMTGIDLTVLTLGLFGVGGLLSAVEKAAGEPIPIKIAGLAAHLRELRNSAWAMVRGAVGGFAVGALPGGGATLASIISYTVERRMSRRPERFGRGAIEGVAAPEAANNAAATSSFIPLLTLGIPGNASIAIVYAALLVNGIMPGPYLVQEEPELFWGVISSMYLGNLMLLLLNLPLSSLWAQITRVPLKYLAPAVGVLTLLGAYSVNNFVNDIWVMLAIGVVAYVARRHGFEPGPLLLAFVLGPILERSLRQSLILSHGSPIIFVDRPISGTLLLLVAVALFGRSLTWAAKRVVELCRRRQNTAARLSR
ncbi:tripartite tricarboxylate transporter permease [Geochorda subterranea]|uniref:Tripartite tricarboxylate transporter permease n=1 Tax=Geochorda subterranea TaxID=3109564 RepID=A0ABZ1BS66_9FIRM|nr:tripartite tricarboxylate transporter permease [Limnochorda sp. LNt]WRP15022.1 tripartite tricarboxylate transporter permease [Limnochorda sp. LNt]